MAKLNRERGLAERRAEKKARKAARRQAADEGKSIEGLSDLLAEGVDGDEPEQQLD